MYRWQTKIYGQRFQVLPLHLINKFRNNLVWLIFLLKFDDFYLTAVIQKKFMTKKVTENRFSKVLVKIKGIIPMILLL